MSDRGMQFSKDSFARRPGLADRGFTVQQTAGIYCAEVKVPAFTQGERQLSAYEVEPLVS